MEGYKMYIEKLYFVTGIEYSKKIRMLNKFS
jgi:hypothetical protein